MTCPTCKGYRSANVWTCVCSDPPVEPAVEARLGELRAYVERRLKGMRGGTSEAIVADVNGEVRRVRDDIAILEARIADQDILIGALVSVIGSVAARKHPLFCNKCRTAYALTGLRRSGKVIELICPVCGPIPWRGGE